MPNYTRFDYVAATGVAVGAKGAEVAITATPAELNVIHSSSVSNADLVKLHAVTSTAAEVSTLHSSGITNADLVKVHAVTAAATDINRALKVATGNLAAADTGGGVFSVALTNNSLVEYVRITVSTVATGACTLDIGVTTTNGTTKIDNLIDGVGVNAATGSFDNIVNAGTSGKSKYYCPAGKWVTASMASGATAGLVGTYAIYYREL